MFLRDEVAGGEVVRYRMASVLLGQPVYVMNCFRIGSVLVDTGPPNNAEELRAGLRGEGVTTVLVTHGHEDHAGNTAWFPHADVRGPAGVTVSRAVPYYRRLTWGEPVAPRPIAAVGDGFDAGELSFRAIPTPGHTPDHVAYWEPDRGWLFTGDAALGPVKYAMAGEDTGQYLASLRALRDLKPHKVFPAHGPVLDHPVDQLGEQIERLERLRDEARQLAREGLSERAITRRLLGLEGVMGRLSGGEFSKLRLIHGLLQEV